MDTPWRVESPLLWAPAPIVEGLISDEHALRATREVFVPLIGLAEWARIVGIEGAQLLLVSLGRAGLAGDDVGEQANVILALLGARRR